MVYGLAHGSEHGLEHDPEHASFGYNGADDCLATFSRVPSCS
jgi:hypothetical protein